MRNALGADVLLVRDGKVLLCRRAHEPYAGRWELPGGFANWGEHPADNARREAREELGLDVRLVGLIGIYLYPYGEREITQATVFLAEGHGEPHAADGEITEWRWWSPDELPSGDDLSPGHHLPLADWVAGLDEDRPAGLRLDG
jgi:ADP-ribose pyrophosphatase YjhB (NUDIX family)